MVAIWIRGLLYKLKVNYYTYRISQLRQAGAGTEHPQVIKVTNLLLELLIPTVLPYEVLNQLDICSNFVSLDKYDAAVNVVAVAIRTQQVIPKSLEGMTHTRVTYPSADWILNTMRNQREALAIMHRIAQRYIDISISLNNVSDANKRSYYSRRLSGITWTSDELIRVFKRLH